MNCDCPNDGGGGPGMYCRCWLSMIWLLETILEGRLEDVRIYPMRLSISVAVRSASSDCVRRA